MPAFAGFDTAIYPGDAAIKYLIQNTNLVWCGYYLAPAPSHPGTTWMGKRTTLQQLGYGLAPVYVGQQVTGPGSKSPSAEQGPIDGANAAALMASEGFAPGSFVYLDIENGPPLTQPQQDYIKTWSAAVAAGGFGPGIYCSHQLAAEVHNLVPQARLWVFNVTTTTAHMVPNPCPNPHPALSGYLAAYAWQLGQNCIVATAAGAKLTVDLDSAITADPGAPDVVETHCGN
jgi:hypothetical protein